MSSEDSIDVTLALVDPTLLSSWEGMVKRGEECSLLLKHSKGKITVTLQCTTPTTPSSSTSSPSSSAKKRKKSKGSKEKRLKALLDYHQRLVVEKGLPPSRLMEQHAAASTTDPSSPAQSSGPKEKQFQCDQCDFSSESQRGLKVHVGRSHKNPEILREELVEDSLNLSQPSDVREDDISSINADLSSMETDLVLPHFCGPNPTRLDESGDQYVFACDDCFHLWRTKEEVQSCSCSTRHNCSPYCLYVNVVNNS